MDLINMYDQKCYPVGYELFVRDKKMNKTLCLVAVPAYKDGDFCRGCYFETACHKYEGLSPIGALCMTTIFVNKALIDFFRR